MKKLNKYGLMGAVLLAGMTGLTACSSDDASDPVNPTFDGKNVKTQFAINIPHSSPAGSRMTEGNTQANGNFLGMNDIRLLPFDGVPGTVTAFTSIIPLPDLATGISATNSSKVYNDVSVPVGTDHFLFYATAPKGQAIADKFAKGYLNADIDGKTALNDISFNLVNTEPEPGSTAETEKGKLLDVLNAVASVDLSAVTSNELKKLHEDFLKLKAGSAKSICATLDAFYQKVDIFATSSTEAADKNAAIAIQNAIKTENVFTIGADNKLTTTNTYPEQLNLPDGSVVVTFDENNKKFSYDTNTTIGTDNNIDITKVCYPASLYYFQNTDIATNDAEVGADNWPKTTTAWTAGFTGWGTEVTSTTSAIALKNNINYAVANLKLTVKCDGNSLTDNGTTERPAIQVNVPTDGFPVTAILIGGQPEKMDWQFKPVGDAFNLTVYDKMTGVNAKASVADGTNYTLVLPNPATEKKTVNFAIELENKSGVEFRGHNGQIIPNDAKFYLIGTLNPADKTVDGVASPDVFMSDYVTTANVTIKSLENAYNVIPDLRATRMELGLSVDLKWETGIVFNVDIQ